MPLLLLPLTSVVSFVDASSGDGGSSSASTATCTMPSAAQAGDVAVVIGCSERGSGVIPVISGVTGWTDLINAADSTQMATYIGWKVVQAGDPGTTITATVSSTRRLSVGVAVYRNVAAGSVVTAVSSTTTSTANGSSDFDVEPPNVTPATDNPMVVSVIGWVKQSSPWTSVNSAVSPATERVDDASTSGTVANAGVWIGDKQVSGGSGVSQSAPVMLGDVNVRYFAATLSLAPQTGSAVAVAARSAVGVAGQASAARVSISTAQGAVAVAASDTVKKVAADTTASRYAVTTSLTPRKAPPAVVVSAVGLTDVPTVKHVLSAVSRGTVGPVSQVTPRKAAPAALAAVVGVVTRGSGVGVRVANPRAFVAAAAGVGNVGHIGSAVTRSVTVAYAAVTPRKTAPGSVVGAGGFVASTTPLKAAPAVIRGVVAGAARNSGVGHVAAAVVRGVTAVAGTASAGKRAPTSVLAPVALRPFHSGTLARAVMATSVVGGAASALARHIARGVVSGVVVVVGRGTSQKTSTPSVASGVGVSARTAAGHVGSASLVSALGVSARPVVVKKLSGSVLAVVGAVPAATAQRSTSAATSVPITVYAQTLIGPQPVYGGDLKTSVRRVPSLGFTQRPPYGWR